MQRRSHLRAKLKTTNKREMRSRKCSKKNSIFDGKIRMIISEIAADNIKASKKKGKTIYICKFCGDETLRRFNAVRHFKRIHVTYRQKTCCKEIFYTKGEYYEHREQKHNEKKKYGQKHDEKKKSGKGRKKKTSKSTKSSVKQCKIGTKKDYENSTDIADDVTPRVQDNAKMKVSEFFTEQPETTGEKEPKNCVDNNIAVNIQNDAELEALGFFAEQSEIAEKESDNCADNNAVNTKNNKKIETAGFSAVQPKIAEKWRDKISRSSRKQSLPKKNFYNKYNTPSQKKIYAYGSLHTETQSRAPLQIIDNLTNNPVNKMAMKNSSQIVIKSHSPNSDGDKENTLKKYKYTFCTPISESDIDTILNDIDF